MKEQETYTNPILPDDASPKGWREIEGESFTGSDGRLKGEDYKVVEYNLPYPAEIDEKEHKLRIRVPIGKLPAPMFSEALVKHCVDTLGRRDAKLVLDKLVDNYYRELVSKQM